MNKGARSCLDWKTFNLSFFILTLATFVFYTFSSSQPTQHNAQQQENLPLLSDTFCPTFISYIIFVYFTHSPCLQHAPSNYVQEEIEKGSIGWSNFMYTRKLQHLWCVGVSAREWNEKLSSAITENLLLL
jgi:hypothetical protein